MCREVACSEQEIQRSPGRDIRGRGVWSSFTAEPERLFRIICRLPSGTRGRAFCAQSEEGVGYASGTVPEVAPPQLRRGMRAGAGHIHSQIRMSDGAFFARVPVLRLARNRQDILRQDTGKGGQLRAPDSRRSLRRVRRLPLHRQRRRHRRAGDGRRLQQRRG